VYLEAKILQTSDNHNEYLLLANIYKKKDNSVKALEWIEKAIALNENEPAQYFFAGDIYYKDNNKEAALKYLQLFQNKYVSLDFSKLSEKKKDEYFKMNSRSIDLINMIQKSK
jgi:tetratricopeptide (TPR) repeat protein